jgi:transcriptional regulator with XRE-family HTH domain
MTQGQDWSSRQLGEYIRAQRQLADLSLRRLADMTEVSNAYLSQIERGMHQPSIRVIRSIAAALNVSADTLLAQAGLIDTTADPVQAPPDTETAIRNDPALTADDRDTLLRVYRSLRKEPPPAE